MKITYWTGIKNLEPSSMRVYRDNLLRELSKIYPNFSFLDYSWKSPIDINIPHFHFDREIYRYFLYPLFASRHYGQINHILDHTYAGIINFLPSKVKKIITIHDLFQYETKVNSFRLFSVPGIKKADAIICVSQATKNDLVNFLGIKKNKIKVIYEGVDTSVFKPFTNRKKQLFPGKKVILNVASEIERKNTLLLIRALAKLVNKFPNLILIRVGKENPKTLTEIKKLKLEKKIRYLENISDKYLVELYNAADLFVLPSLQEGFGLPVLEAMACGCPVICSNASSLPEVVGDSAIFVNNHNIDFLAKEIESVLINESLKNEMIKRGLKQAKKFDWEKTAQETLMLYKQF